MIPGLKLSVVYPIPKREKAEIRNRPHYVIIIKCVSNPWIYILLRSCRASLRFLPYFKVLSLTLDSLFGKILMIRFQSVYHCICMFYRLTWLEGFYFRGILTLIKPVGVCLGETHVKFDDTYLQRRSELSPSKESVLLCTIIFPLKLTWQRAIFNNSFNRPFYSYRWKRGWSWPCFDTTLPALLCKSCCFYWC